MEMQGMTSQVTLFAEYRWKQQEGELKRSHLFPQKGKTHTRMIGRDQEPELT